MPNELLWILFVILDLSAVLLFFRLFGRQGLYLVMATSIIVCNIQVLKLVDLFGLPTTLGNILYAGIFFSTDLLSEVYGKKAARRGVWLAFCSLAAAVVYMWIALQFIPAPVDTVQPAMERIFAVMPRIALASIAAYLASQFHDVWAFHFWKEKTAGRHLWFRNNASTLVSQLIDSVIFCLIAFAGELPLEIFMGILLTTYLFKLIVALADTPFLYLGRKLAKSSTR